MKHDSIYILQQPAH